MICHHCNGSCLKKGKTPNGIQKYRCQTCKRYQREDYQRNGCKGKIASQVKTLVKECCGIRSISRILNISPTTVLKMIRQISAAIEKPVLRMHREYEMDELKTHVQKKKNEQWIIYAIDRKTRQVADFRIGRRNKSNLKAVIDSLLYSKTKCIYTDQFNLYPSLIPKDQHISVVHNTNYIERKNLNLRTHVKCLTRKGICFSKNVIMLMSIMKIYFWG